MRILTSYDKLIGQGDIAIQLRILVELASHLDARQKACVYRAIGLTSGIPCGMNRYMRLFNTIR